MNAHIVSSCSGDYEEYRAYPIAVFTGRDAVSKAAAFVEACEAYHQTKPEAEDEGDDDDAWERNYERVNAWKAAHPLDPHFDTDTSYRTEAVALNPVADPRPEPTR